MSSADPPDLSDFLPWEDNDTFGCHLPNYDWEDVSYDKEAEVYWSSIPDLPEDEGDLEWEDIPFDLQEKLVDVSPWAETESQMRSDWGVSMQRAETIRVLAHLDPEMTCRLRSNRAEYLVTCKIFSCSNSRVWITQEEALEVIRVLREVYDLACSPISKIAEISCLGNSSTQESVEFPLARKEAISEGLRLGYQSQDSDSVGISRTLIRDILLRKKELPRYNSWLLGEWLPKRPKTFGSLRRINDARHTRDKYLWLVKKYKVFLTFYALSSIKLPDGTIDRPNPRIIESEVIDHKWSIKMVREYLSRRNQVLRCAPIWERYRPPNGWSVSNI